MAIKNRSLGADRQRKLRARRAKSGQIRREYWATKSEHEKLQKKLDDLRGNEPGDALVITYFCAGTSPQFRAWAIAEISAKYPSHGLMFDESPAVGICTTTDSDNAAEIEDFCAELRGRFDELTAK